MDRPFSFRSPAAGSPLTARERVLAQWRGWDWSAVEKANRPSSKKAAEIMPRVLVGLRIDQRQAEAEILRVWKNSIDPNIVAHARPTGIRHGTLFVSVDSSVWLDEIVRYRRHEILERLQSSFGRDLISRISYRIG